MGVDYLVSPDLLVGLGVAVDTIGQEDIAAPGSTSGTGWLVGPYATGRITDSLFFNLRAAAGRSSNRVDPFGLYTDTFDATRWLLSASLAGKWSKGGWTFAPVASVSYVQQVSDPYTDGMGVFIPTVVAGLGEAALAPAVSYTFVTEGDIRITAGAGLEGALTFTRDGGTLAHSGFTSSVSANIGLTLPGGAMITATGSAGAMTDKSTRVLSGSLRFSAAIH